MQQKFKFLYFAIVAASCIFSAPANSNTSGYHYTHTPGETVGANARPAISCGNPGYDCTHVECIDKLVQAKLGTYHRMQQDGTDGWVYGRAGEVQNPTIGERDRRNVGLGDEIRYIQSTGGYCYYYNGGISSGNSGPNTWRYDPR